ncbi:MAG: Cell division protein FtsK [Planctomycetaceae bacterium]|nr:Cell division protein FtsK [Planctomycetaceae bacterium]
MPVTLTVSQIRDALYRADGMTDARGEGAASTAILGTWFHEGLGWLVGSTAPGSPLAMLDEVDANLDVWKKVLVDQTYARFVGPRLTQQNAALHDVALQVGSFWQAMQAACHWVAELTWRLAQERKSFREQLRAPWQELAACISTEEPLVCEIREAGWSDSVRMIGIADAVVRRTDIGAWCAIEIKLGRTSPAVDLGQACLYHMILSAAANADESSVTAVHVGSLGSLALVSFQPELHERVFSAQDLKMVKQRLLDVIGKLAGVTESAPIKVELRKRVVPSDAHLTLGRGLVKTLHDYGVSVELNEPIIVGPTFLRFPIKLGRGTKVSAAEKLTAELQVHLKLEAEPFISRELGQLVIDVQRKDREKIYFRDVRSQMPTPKPGRGGSHVPVGVNLSGELICANLAEPQHAHFLVAGTTGSGKSEWLRLAIVGLLVTNSPETLRLLVIDPKRNAFHALKDSPFLWKPLVFPDETPAADVLEELAEEMDRRYRLLDGADSISQLADSTGQVLPRIVCVCDEYRDLISRGRAERKAIEQQICRLGAKARAAGIHLILATQEPSRDTIMGPLASNVPARVGLKMGKHIESTMLLNERGAEKLLGNGDLLFKDVGNPRRLQAPMLDEAERKLVFGEGCS